MAILKSLIVNGVARVIGDLTASKIIKQGGVSSQFLKADGSVDSTSYYHSGNKPSLSDLGAAASSHTHSYLPLSGGTITGSLTFANGTWNVVGDDAAIGDYNVAGSLGLKSINNNIPSIGFHNSSNTLLGTLKCDAGTLKWNTNTIWHTGNDGSGSGLDADTLDGYHSSSFATAGHTHSYLPLGGGTLSGELISQNGGIWVQGGSSAGGNVGRMGLIGGMPADLAYNTSKRGVRIYSNAIALADPYNGNDNNDSGWIRHIEETQNSGILEIAVGDDGSEEIRFRRYNTASNIVSDVLVPNASGTLALTSQIPTSLPANGGNADTVDSQHFSYSNDSNSPTYLWATNSNGSSFLAARGSISVNYADSAGSVAWDNITEKPNSFTPSSHTHNSINGSDNRSVNNTPNWYMTNIGKASIYTEFCMNGGAISSTYENRTTFTPWIDSSGEMPVQLAFNNSGMFMRTSSSSTTWNAWNTIWHSGNDGSGSGLDADKLDGYHATCGNNKPWGTIPAITDNGYMDVGRHFEFHYDNTTGSDFSTALMCSGNYGNVVNLPSASGTLALTSQIPTSLPANGGNADYATSAGSVDWSGVTNRPTNVSQFTNDAGYKTTDTTYSTATSNTLGLVKIGYTANGRNYPVQLSDGKMYVNVPWTDTDTNTWRPITDSYSGTDSNTSLSQKGGNDIYNALINGYASSAGSSTYSNTLEVQDVRGSDIIPSKFDSHRITGWFNESTGLLSGNWCSGITVKGWHDGYSSWQLAGYSSTSFGKHGLFFREAANDSGWRDWIQVITSDNISSQTVAIANLARTLSQDNTINLYVHNNNELNFGGTNASTTIYFGYRAADSRAIPTSFVFGGSTGSATLTANGFIKKDSSDSYVLLGGGGHKVLSDFVQISGDQSISGTKTFSGTIKANRAESTTGFFQTSDIRYKNIIEYYYNLSDKIAQLPIIKYKWTDRDDDSIRIGSSAQSVMNIIPELVSYDNNTDFYSLDYATLGAVAGISACKEVEMLKQKIKELEQEIITLKSKYNG